eukprot:gb/GEZN01002171.1/.p1 GENE.gb/GEZN01002171.1/~~gb/GEZN01002171.1/.p1  ORF type:complete len:638 (+),score=88.14 gb/GEZN01002171.1/:243-1916(+)
MFEDRNYTYKQVEEGANRVAHWAKAGGIGKGSVVALYMDNRPEFFMVWLGVSKAGGVTALINYNVKGVPLVHCLKVCGATTLIVGATVHENVEHVEAQLKRELKYKIFSMGGPLACATHLDPLLAMQPILQLPRSQRAGLNFYSDFLLVYTSGTTGLPKAATIKHARFFSMGFAFTKLFGMRHDDILYTVLPLYHSAGGLCGTGMMMHTGCTMVLRSRFSLTSFWPDCRKYNCTVIQYIGELCRYLTAAPKDPLDAKNKVRLAIGNGLRPEVWDEFQDRFGITEVGEFYGSTEGNAALFNHCTDKRSRYAVGRSGLLLQKLTGIQLVKFDVVTEEPVRGPDGFCIPCGPNEPGELLGLIDDADPLKKFDGYHGNKAATNKKLLLDAFKKGDKYFRTGDLLRQDSDGYWYFVDRIGDTFRWKGENVSTTEVTEVVSVAGGIAEANVYGISLPGQDGRACAVAVVLKEGLTATTMDWKTFASHCDENLPSYAMPLFIRILPQIAVTGTFKHQKVELVKQGVDPTLVEGDALLWYNASSKTYVPFGLDEWKEVALGKARL